MGKVEFGSLISEDGKRFTPLITIKVEGIVVNFIADCHLESEALAAGFCKDTVSILRTSLVGTIIDKMYDGDPDPRLN